MQVLTYQERRNTGSCSPKTHFSRVSTSPKPDEIPVHPPCLNEAVGVKLKWQRSSNHDEATVDGGVGPSILPHMGGNPLAPNFRDIGFTTFKFALKYIKIRNRRYSHHHRHHDKKVRLYILLLRYSSSFNLCESVRPIGSYTVCFWFLNHIYLLLLSSILSDSLLDFYSLFPLPVSAHVWS